MSDEPKVHPVQTKWHPKEGAQAPTCVTLLAYEVYCAVYGPQEAVVTGWCRGGFSAGELIAYLYARNFPRAEWRRRVDEAHTGMRHL